MRAALFVFFIALSGCSATDFEPRRLAQSDTQLVIERVRNQLDEDLDTLTTKLYARNPIFLQRAGRTLQERKAMLREARFYSELEEKRGSDAVRLAFRDDFAGDRVFAFVYGLASMIDESYGRKREFYLLDGPSGQFVFNSARNIDTATYLLRTQTDSQGNPYLLADGYQGDILNASFSQLLGRLSAKQDVVADMLGDGQQRQVNAVARGVFTTVFLPIGL